LTLVLVRYWIVMTELCLYHPLRSVIILATKESTMSNDSFLGLRPSTQGRFRTGLLVALLCAAGLQTAGAATLMLVPGESSVSIGDTVSVDLNISGLGADTAPSLGAYDITIDVPSIFTFDNVVFGDPILGGDQLGSGAFTETVLGSNTVDLVDVSLESVATLNSLQPDAFTLAVLNLTANSTGSGNFSFGDITLGDASANKLSYNVSDANAAAAVVSSAPEPSALLPLCGLLALIGLMRKRICALTRS